jgi:hypothetical protein
MNLRNLSNRKRVRYIASALLTVLGGTGVIYSQKANNTSKPEEVRGNVFASINMFTYGSGVGPRYESFIYQIKSDEEADEKKTQLVRVIYEFFDKKDRLDKSFFDFSKEYKLLLTRDVSCDKALGDFAYQRVSDSDERITIVKALPGADKTLLRDDLTMPCYVLEAPNFKKQ